MSGTSGIIINLLAVAFLASIFLLGHKFETIRAEHKQEWLSFSGGVSIAYVFMHLLPELDIMLRKLPQDTPAEWMNVIAGYRVYVMALIGFGTFYGLERMAHYAAEKQGRSVDSSHASLGRYRVYLLGYVLYSVLIGYMVGTTSVDGFIPLMLICVVMAFHFLMISHLLEHHFLDHYQFPARIMLALSLIIGWLIALLVELPDRAKVILFSFIVGSIIVNSIKEEVPGGADSRFLPFLVGAVGTLVVILMIYSHLGH